MVQKLEKNEPTFGRTLITMKLIFSLFLIFISQMMRILNNDSWFKFILYLKLRSPGFSIRVRVSLFWPIRASKKSSTTNANRGAWGSPWRVVFQDAQVFGISALLIYSKIASLTVKNQRHPLGEWMSLIWASSKVIFRQTSKGDIPKTFVTNKTNLRGNFELDSNLILSHLRRHLRF